MPKSLLDKIWDAHVVTPERGGEEPGSPAVLYVDLHLVHEVTSPQAFQTLRERGLKVRRPDKTLGTLDHSIPTLPAESALALPILDAQAAKQLKQMETNCRDFGIQLYTRATGKQGVVHVVGPEQG
jgi:3-isopropylmalate/(R)-2-methylmalate dehydratase large subunit